MKKLVILGILIMILPVMAFEYTKTMYEGETFPTYDEYTISLMSCGSPSVGQVSCQFQIKNPDGDTVTKTIAVGATTMPFPSEDFILSLKSAVPDASATIQIITPGVETQEPETEEEEDEEEEDDTPTGPWGETEEEEIEESDEVPHMPTDVKISVRKGWNLLPLPAVMHMTETQWNYLTKIVAFDAGVQNYADSTKEFYNAGPNREIRHQVSAWYKSSKSFYFYYPEIDISEKLNAKDKWNFLHVTPYFVDLSFEQMGCNVDRFYFFESGVWSEMMSGEYIFESYDVGLGFVAEFDGPCDFEYGQEPTVTEETGLQGDASVVGGYKGSRCKEDCCPDGQDYVYKREGTGYDSYKCISKADLEDINEVYPYWYCNCREYVLDDQEEEEPAPSTKRKVGETCSNVDSWRDCKQTYSDDIDVICLDPLQEGPKCYQCYGHIHSSEYGDCGTCYREGGTMKTSSMKCWCGTESFEPRGAWCENGVIKQQEEERQEEEQQSSGSKKTEGQSCSTDSDCGTVYKNYGTMSLSCIQHGDTYAKTCQVCNGYSGDYSNYKENCEACYQGFGSMLDQDVNCYCPDGSTKDPRHLFCPHLSDGDLCTDSSECDTSSNYYCIDNRDTGTKTCDHCGFGSSDVCSKLECSSCFGPNQTPYIEGGSCGCSIDLGS